MKKLLLYSALALSMAFSSCSRDDNTNPQTPKGDGTVTVTVTLPDGVLADAGSRAMPSAYPGHKLRCILIVEENGAVTIRQEKLADEAQDGSFFFDITPGQRGLQVPVLGGLHQGGCFCNRRKISRFIL